MWDGREIKARGKAAFQANYWACVIVAFILAFAVGGGASSNAGNGRDEAPEPDSSTVRISVAVAGGAGTLGLLVQVLALNPLQAGCAHFYLENSRENGKKPDVGEVLYFFKEGRWGNAVKVMFVYKLFLTLWFLLLLVPGFVKAYSYRLVPYLLCENPEIGAREAIDRSRQLMDGEKLAAFSYDLSYFGWILLGVVTLGLGLAFYVSPWMNSANAFLCRAIAGEDEE